MRSSKVIIDYDGVVLRSPKAIQVIQKRCERFVGHVTGIRCDDRLALVNRHLYQTHGHTVLGLRSLGHNVAVRDFNNFVYNTMTDIDIQPEYDFDLVGLSQILSAYPNDVYIYSNAPSKWIIETMSNNVTKHHLDKLQIIGPKNQESLKPDMRTFLDIRNQLYPGTKKNNRIYFIDDNFRNIQASVQVKDWYGLWRTGMDFMVSKDITSVADLSSALFQIKLNKHCDYY